MFVSTNPWKLGKEKTKGTKSKGRQRYNLEKIGVSGSEYIRWPKCLDFIQWTTNIQCLAYICN